MEVLEIKPLKKKKLKIYLIESEFPIEWGFESSIHKNHSLVMKLRLISKEYLNLLGELINKYHPDFLVEEKGSRWEEVISPDDAIARLLRKYDILYQMIDISDNAEDYLSMNLDGNRNLIKQLEESINGYSNSKEAGIKNEFEFERAALWKEHLQQEYNELENEVRFKVREAWMIMKILKIAKNIDNKNVEAFFICDLRHFEGLYKLTEDLGVSIEEIKIKRESKIVKNSDLYPYKNMMNNSIIKLTPIIIKKKEQLGKICYFFDTDENASPFDINKAYDAGFDVIVPFSNIKAFHVPKLVRDAIFSRKPGAPTTFFIGGSNITEVEKIRKELINSLVPPFECPVIIDPNGSHTTASSLVAETIEIAKEHNIDNLVGKKVVILGAGPVARISAILSAKLKCETHIVETWNKSTKILTENLAKELSKEAGVDSTNIKGDFAVNDKQKFEILKDANIIWSLAAAGVQVLSKELLSNLKNKLIVDINLVPPYGIDGLKPNDYNKEIFTNIFGTGALPIGRLKSKVEEHILKEAANTKGKKVFDYNYAFEQAKKIFEGNKGEISP